MGTLQQKTAHDCIERIIGADADYPVTTTPAGRWGLTPEMVAAVSKLMRNQDLVAVARKIKVVTAFRNTIGLPGRLSTRLPDRRPGGYCDGDSGWLAAGLGGCVYRYKPGG
jgi:ethanolamine ammonia-lyase large subunit